MIPLPSFPLIFLGLLALHVQPNSGNHHSGENAAQKMQAHESFSLSIPNLAIQEHLWLMTSVNTSSVSGELEVDQLVFILVIYCQCCLL